MNSLWRRLVRLETGRAGRTVAVIIITGGLPGRGLDTAALAGGGTLLRGEGEDEAVFVARAADEASRRGLAWTAISGLPESPATMTRPLYRAGDAAARLTERNANCGN